ncbi:hypothetical protein EV368DRAFT_48849 [Lentinula lateritia]|uniref:Uncharacterized protein n=1 Tax=Lentinula aff. lateritia TaxID=2804960 RepID=A0ACC1U8P4_9AGAR|nr:hypothetical protein F5876DRAFT_35081 [Lentinula aff. lateritia]KAJ3848664.1 hypothetical protein EV368DRAFT_48849 [Lentinula lateritia]
MCRNVSSPIFDVPAFPTLRRVKPLPKRRRTSSTHFSILDSGLPPIPLSLPGPDATAEELLAHADALQSYYFPILDAAAANINAVADGFANAAEPAGLEINNLSLRDRDEHSDRGDGDYIDQPGNAKKRKVPANTSHLQGARDANSGEEEVEDRDGSLMIGIPTGAGEEGKSSMSTLRRLLGRRKTRLSAVTLAGLQHKETLKVRKRQLAAVLGALSLGDTLALDQALSTNSAYPFSSSSSAPNDALVPLPVGGKPSFKIRLSKRAGPRVARSVSSRSKDVEESHVQVPESDFTFVCYSATADRLSATKKEVATLRRRFEDELARQASNAASLAAATRAVASPLSSRSSRQKRSGKARTDKKLRNQPPEFLDPALDSQTSGAGGMQNSSGNIPSSNAKSSRNGKKKKRSALANASNPHHLRNYVPSRLPYNAGGCPPNANGTNQANGNDLGPFPIRFLSAEIPPRRSNRSKRSQAQEQQQSSTSLTNPADEWLCVFCEYELFFGDEGEYRKALRRRKTVLKRRRRARERAAAAASGHSKLSTAKKSQQPAPVAATHDFEEEGDDEDSYGDDAGYEPMGTGGQTVGNGVNGMLPKQTKWRGDNREKGAGEAKSSYG